VALHLNTNDPPPSGNWALIAAKGDAGPAGAAGAQGPPGAAGTAGGTEVYAVTAPGPNGIGFQPEGTDIGSLSLPAGSYVIMASVAIFNVDADDQNWTLELRIGDTVLTNGGGRLITSSSANGTLMVLFTAVNDSATTITLRGYGYNIVVYMDVSQPFSLVAMKVGTLHNG